MKKYRYEVGFSAEKRADRGSGYVYLIRPVLGKKSKWFTGKENCPVKIGVSKDNKNGIKSRLKALSSGTWVKLCVETISPKLLEPYNVEYVLHRELKSHGQKIKGEWFSLSLNDIKKIKYRLKKEPEVEHFDFRDIDHLDCYGHALTCKAYEYDLGDWMNSHSEEYIDEYFG